MQARQSNWRERKRTGVGQKTSDRAAGLHGPIGTQWWYLYSRACWLE